MTRQVELKVGIFVFIGLVSLFGIYMWLSNIDLSKRWYKVSVVFPDVEGLKVNDVVKVRGVERGKVENIILRDDDVYVELLVDASVVLKKDAKVEIKDVAMISGTKFIDLDPGSVDELWDLSEPLRGKPTWRFTLESVGDIAGSLAKLAESLKGPGGKALTAMLAQMVYRLDSLTATVQQMTIAHRGDLTRLFVLMDSVLVSVDSLSSVLYRVSSRIDAGKGTVGKLVKEDSLYNRMMSTLEEAEALIKDIKENPKKYLTIEVF